MKTLVITSGSSGVGYALVRRLVSNGHRVISLDVVAPTTQEIEFVHCDLGELQEWYRTAMAFAIRRSLPQGRV